MEEEEEEEDDIDAIMLIRLMDTVTTPGQEELRSSSLFDVRWKEEAAAGVDASLADAARRGPQTAESDRPCGGEGGRRMWKQTYHRPAVIWQKGRWYQ